MTTTEEAPAVDWTDWRALSAAERRKMRALARKAGYVSPYPAPGKAPAGGPCPECGKEQFVSLRGEVRCLYTICPANREETP